MRSRSGAATTTRSASAGTSDAAGPTNACGSNPWSRSSEAIPEKPVSDSLARSISPCPMVKYTRIACSRVKRATAVVMLRSDG